MAKKSQQTAEMRRVMIDVSFDLTYVRVEAWDDNDKHYLGSAIGTNADTYLDTLFKAVSDAFPKGNAKLPVSGFTIPNT